MAGRDRFTVDIKCSGCGQAGAVMWEENSLDHRQNGAERALLDVSPGFHSETGRTKSGDPLIVCDRCDTIQAD